MRVELRMAWREFRPAWRRFAFMIAAIALGVGSITGIKGFSQALDRAMQRSARELVAADLAVRFPSSPDGRERAALEALVARGARMTRVTETISMASTAGSGRTPLLSSVKAIDPAAYPYYGTVQIEPFGPLARILTGETAIVTSDLLTRSEASVGDTVQLGESSFRIAAVLRSEPDRIASGVELGPRILITRDGLERAGLIRFGSRAAESFLFRLPERGLTLDEARGLLRDGIGQRARMVDYRDPNPSLSRGLERTANFLSLIGLLALLVGGLGVATTVHSYLQQKLDTIAILKCIGARSSRIVGIYVTQGLGIGIAGSACGVGLGYAVQMVFPRVLGGILTLPTELEPAPTSVLQGFVIGMLVTLLFLLPPLLAVRRVRPIRVFLREMPETRLSTLRRLRHDPLPAAAGVLLVAGVVLSATWLAESLWRGLLFVGGITAAILILAAGARALFAGLRRVPRPRQLVLRHGLRNLNRPGGQATSVLVALGLGVAFVLCVYLIQTSLLSQIVRSAPANFPNMFLLGITSSDRDTLWSMLRSHPAVVDAGEPIPSVPSRLLRINGKTEDQLGLDRDGRRYFQFEFVLTWAEKQPPESPVVEGEWWKPPFAEPLASVGRNAARHLGIVPGATVEFSAGGTPITARVANIREIEFGRPGTNNQFILSPGALEGVPASYVGALRVRPALSGGLQRDLFGRYPAVTSVDVADVLVRVQGILDRVAAVIRFVGAFSILSGVIILSSSVVATRFQRIREAALLKTLGATRARVGAIHATEFAIIGLAAGIIGSLLAAAAAKYLLGELLDTEFEMRWIPLIVTSVATASLTVVTGWISSRGVLNHRPLEVLREN